MKNIKHDKKSERGGAGVKMVAVLLGLFLVAHAAYNYIPVAYEGQNFKQEMQSAVLQGMASPNGITPAEMVKGKIQKAFVNNNIPSNATFQIKPAKDGVSAHVNYSREVPILPFGLYTYNYQFDHTATPTGFLMKSN